MTNLLPNAIVRQQTVAKKPGQSAARWRWGGGEGELGLGGGSSTRAVNLPLGGRVV